MGPIESLDALLIRHVAAVHETAGNAAAGGDTAWDSLMRQYAVTPFDVQERSIIVRHMHLARGATPAEVRIVLQGVQRWAEQELSRLRSDATWVDAPAFRALAERVATLAERETSAYERILGLSAPPPMAPELQRAPAAPSLASIFANAEQTSKQAGMKFKQVSSLACVHCGAPQEEPSDFMCRYCRRPIASALP